MQAAGEATEVGADLAVILWRACSGLAHGDFWASITLPGRAHLAATARLRRVATAWRRRSPRPSQGTASDRFLRSLSAVW